MSSADDRDALIAALRAGGHMGIAADTRPRVGEDYGEAASFVLEEGDAVEVVVGEGADFDSYGETGDVFLLGPSQYGDGGKTLFSGGGGRGFTLRWPDGKWKANTHAGTILRLIQSGKFKYVPRTEKART